MSNIIKVNGGNGSGRVIKLITKSISANGTYQATSDDADGYTEVRVSTAPITTPMIFSDGRQQLVLSSILGNLDYTYKFKLYISNYQTETLILGSDWNVGCKLFHTYGSLGSPTLYYYTNNTPISIPSTLNKILDVEMSTDYIKIDGVTYSDTAASRASSAISLFGFSTTHRSSVGIGEFQVYDNSDDSLVMDLVPMKDSSTGEGYFYDTVGEQSYYSSTAYPLHYLAITETNDPVTLIDKTITANGTYYAPDDNANGYSKIDVDVQAKLNPVAFTDATHIEQYNRTITISDYEAVAQIVTDTTYCTGVITLPVTNFTKDEFIMGYSITTPSAVGGNYYARCFFSDTVPTNPWTTQENYGHTQLAQSSSDWTGIMQRFEIPSGASYFNIEVGGTSFSSIKLYEEAQPTLISKTITQNGTYLAHTDNAYGYSEIDAEVPGGLIITDLIPTPATSSSTEPFANTQWDANAAAWHAFDKDISTCWASGNGMAGNWQIGYAFHEPVVVNRVKIINRDDPTWGVSQSPQVFWIYASNDGENWTEISSGGHIWSGLNEEFIYDFENSDAYSIWKIHTKLSMAGATGNLSLSIIGFYNRTYLPA